MGRVLISRVLAQQPLLPGMLAAKNAGSGLAALIPPNMRAIAVRVDDVVGVAGFIHADDRVDVIVTLRPNQPGRRGDDEGLPAERQGARGRPGARDRRQGRLHATAATVATLLVSPQDAERLALAQTEGRLMFTLRSWTDSQPVDTDGASARRSSAAARPRSVDDRPPRRAGHPTVVVRAAGRRQGRTAAAADPTAEAPKKDIVEILRGDRFEQRNFNRGDKR